MDTPSRAISIPDGSWLVTHPLTGEDRASVTAIRAVVGANKGRMRGTAAREPYDGIMGRVAAPPGVAYEADVVGDVSGWWCRPTEARPGRTILHLHGGWFHWGSARAFRHLVGHLAARAGAEAFLPDYRLAPEHPFPSAVEDVRACYAGLVDRGARRIALTGDSAGGGLALVLLRLTTSEGFAGGVRPVGAAALSPVTDLTLSGTSWGTRAIADPYFTREQVSELVGSYLGGADPTDPRASPLHGNLAGLPPIRVHAGEDEVLLDDSRRYVERAVSFGVDARLDVWEGMPHGFLGGIGNLAAAEEAMGAIGEFLAGRLATGSLIPPGRP